MRKLEEAKGIKVKTLEEEPKLGRHLGWIWKAFTDLNYRRGAGFSGPVPLSYSDIESYCRLKGIYSLGERERLLRFLDVLDRKYMADAYEKAAKASAVSKPPPPSNAPQPRGPRRPPRKAVS